MFMDKILNPKFIVFDLDGLLIDSLPSLSEAIVEVVRPLFSNEESLNLFVTFDLANPGLSRFEKINYALDIAGVKNHDRERKMKQLLLTFDELALKARCEAELDHSIFDFLTLSSINIDVYLLSNCDNAQLIQVMANHKIDSIFGKNSCGTPPRKSEIFPKIISNRKFELNSIWSISDSRSDLIIANNNLVKFFWIQKYAREKIFDHEISGMRCDSLKDLYKIIDK
jgi:phosphoglycolate phosphatase-like HAD superfamily hydrolase